MELKDERYEFDFEKVGKEGGMAIDVVANPDKTEEPSPFPEGMKGLSFMSQEKGEGETRGHDIWGYIQFKDMDNLKLAQMGIELLQMAVFKEAELAEAENQEEM